MIKKILVLVMLLAFAAWYFMRPGTLSPKPPGAASLKLNHEQPYHFIPNAEARSPQKLNLKAEDELQALKSGASIREQMPSLNEVRAEVQKDPLATPAPLLKFSSVLEAKIKIAMKSEAAARVIVIQLQDCALANVGQNANSASAMCLLNAHKLSNKYTSLAPEVDAIDSRTDHNTLRIYQSMRSQTSK
jgi:hypothetical protein